LNDGNFSAALHADEFLPLTAMSANVNLLTTGTLSAASRRLGVGERGDQGCPEPKTLTPSAKREAIRIMVQNIGCRSCALVRLPGYRGRRITGREASVAGVTPKS
jgi:hypothetical protein